MKRGADDFESYTIRNRNKKSELFFNICNISVYSTELALDAHHTTHTSGRIKKKNNQHSHFQHFKKKSKKIKDIFYFRKNSTCTRIRDLIRTPSVPDAHNLST